MCFCIPRISFIIATKWTLQNHMKFNSGKSKEMIISYAEDWIIVNIQFTTQSFAYQLPACKTFRYDNYFTSYAKQFYLTE